MGYAVYADIWHPGRWAGYAVPAECDMTGCSTMIERGMGYQCEEIWGYRYLKDGVEVSEDDDWDDEQEVQTEGCYLYFCSEHEDHEGHKDAQPKPDHPKWSWWMLTAPSWQKWREEAREALLTWHRENATRYEPDQEMLDEVAYDSAS
jgi:hypothetical protein